MNQQIGKLAKKSGRGSAPGERRGGRMPGVPNKITIEIRTIAQKYGGDAIATLREVMQGKEMPPAARVAAAKELLDRAYGRSPQPLVGDDSMAAIRQVIEMRIIDPA